MPVTNADVATTLRQIRTLMEFAEKPYFEVMAYERAAAAVENATPLADLAREDRLTEIPGVGKTIAGRIAEIVATGRSSFLDELLARYPPSLLDLLAVPGVGIKTARMLFERYGIASVDDLERSIASGALDDLPRIGKKTVENWRRGILAARGRNRRKPIGFALPLAREIVAFLREDATAQNVAFAGSLRRQEVTVGDIDIVCTSRDPGAVIARFVGWSRAEAVLAEGTTKASIWLDDGFQIDLRVLDESVYGNLLQHFTGSREHNIALRELAVRKGLRVSENGILDLATGQNFVARTEDAVYAHLGLAYIAPEMRLSSGEIEAAADGTLPTPVAREDLRGDFHMHCTWSDGADSLAAMVERAKQLGYAYHAVSDHSQGRRGWGLDADALRRQRSELGALGDRFGIRVLASAEVDILPDGSLDYSDEVLAELDLVIASVHSATNQSRDDMTARLVRACEHPHVTIVGHPTGRHVSGFGGYDFDHDAVFAAAARTGTALEIDGQPDRLDLPSPLARRARDFGVTFSCDSDAHSAAELDNVEYAIGQARRAWIARHEVLNARPLDDVLAFVAAKRARART